MGLLRLSCRVVSVEVTRERHGTGGPTSGATANPMPRALWSR
jgi:hypothetical protein